MKRSAQLVPRQSASRHPLTADWSSLSTPSSPRPPPRGLSPPQDPDKRNVQPSFVNFVNFDKRFPSSADPSGRRRVRTHYELIMIIHHYHHYCQSAIHHDLFTTQPQILHWSPGTRPLADSNKDKWPVSLSLPKRILYEKSQARAT